MAELSEDIQRLPKSTRPKKIDRVVANGLTLINDLEKEICGPGLTNAPSQSEGMAMAGVRTAVAPHLGTARADLRPLPMVVHVVTQSTDSELPDAPVQMVASSHQDAVDQTLAAHLISSRIKAPVVATVDDWIASSLGTVTSLEQTSLRKLLAVTPASAEVEEQDLQDPEWISGQIEESLNSLTEIAGRKCAAVNSRIDSDCDRVFISAGSTAALLTRLQNPAGKAGTITVNVLKPFPTQAVAGLIPAGAEVVVVGQIGCAVHDSLAESLQNGLASGEIQAKGIVQITLDSIPESARALSARLEKEMPGLDLELVGKARRETGCCVGVSPAGTWAREILSSSISQKEDSGLTIVEHHGYSVLTAGDDSELEALILIQTEFSYPAAALHKIKKGGQVLYLSPDKSPAAALSWIRTSDLEMLEERDVELWWVSCPPGMEVLPSDVSELLSTIQSKDVQGTGIVFTGSTLDTPRPFQLEKLDTVGLQPLLSGAVAIFDSPVELPILTDDKPVDQERWQNGLREFHLTGDSALRQASLSPDVPLLPAACRELSKSGLFQRAFPLFLSDSGETVLSLDTLLREAIQDGADDGIDFAILKVQVRTLVHLVESALTEDLMGIETIHQTLDQCLDVFDVSEHGRSKLGQEVAALKELLPNSGKLVRFSPTAWFPLLGWAVSNGRAEARRRLLQDVRDLLFEMDSILKADQGISEEAQSSGALSLAVGESDLIDPTALASVIPKARGPMGLSKERRDRIGAAKDSLAQLLKSLEAMPALYTVSSSEIDLPADSDIETITHPEPFQVALGLYDGTLERSLEAFKAMRIARLEITDDYSPEAHDAILKRMTWEACSVDELLALPAIVVCEPSPRLASKSLGDFNHVLHSGRPIMVLVTNPHPTLDDLLGQPTDIGYLGLAHRESYVLQSSFAVPDHLIKGLREMSGLMRPAVAVLAVPDPDSTSWEWRRSIVSQYSRSTPAFSYNPSLGDSWADCFSLQGNPEPESTWLSYDVNYSEADGSLGLIEDRLTFAHFAALDPHFREHFLTLPSDAWAEELVPLAEYLEQYRNTPPAGIPFIWVLDEQHSLQRAILTREMAQACRNRQRAWRILQELAGLNNSYVVEAVEKVRAETKAEVDESRAAELEKARSEGAALAVERLVAIFTDPAAAQTLAPAQVQPIAQAPAVPAKAQTAAPAVPQEVPPEVTEEEEEEEVILEEAYIDSYLCSSCNDCINVNPLMFKYNQEKQAYIADITAGTYAQLVKAAEGCPASCIHPGAPRPGDETASQELVDRARTFQ
ncbi:MAG: ferredoxin [Acidobacteriota bacterium]|nr:MAG: ferredoxin [Acidobacteriota bacterium]